MPKSVVSIVKGKDAQEMVEEALSLLGGVSSLIRPESVVILKPNAGREHPPGTSGCTSPEMVAAVIKEVRKAKPKEIIVAESSAIGADTLESLKASGITKAAEDAGVDRIIDIKREKDLIDVAIRGAQSDFKRVPLPRFLLEADHLVNLPILKAHTSLVITCALKNLKGIVQDKAHFEMHQTNLFGAICDLWCACKADLQIVDAIRPGEGYAPAFPLPADFGCVVASKDPVAVDATCCRMIGLDFDKVRWHFQTAHDQGVGEFEEKNIEIRGRKIEEVFKPLWFPFLGGFEQWPEYHIYSGGACSGCQCIVATYLEQLKAIGEYDKYAGSTIVIGRPKDFPKGVPKEKLFLFGNCVKKYRDQGVWCAGCPTGPAGYLLITDGQELPKPEEYPPEARDRLAKNREIFQDYMVKKRQEFDSETKVPLQ